MTRRQRMGQATTIEPGATPAGTVAATPACGPRTSGGRERIAWMALLLVTLAIHLVALGARPPHHDEAVHGDFGHNLLVDPSQYHYDPTYHGPLLFYTLAPIFAVFGESNFTARLYPALAGVALVMLPLALRRRIGPGTAWWTGVVLALSPSFLYFSRFARNDVPVVLFTAVALVLFLLVRRRRWKVIPWIGVAAACHAISKETFYVLLPLLAVAAWAVAVRGGVWLSVRRTFAWIDRYRLAVGVALCWFFVLCMAAYTVGFTRPEDWFFPGKAISYWYGQHTIQRVGGPWHFHLPRLALYEFLPLVAATVWVVRRRARLRPIEVFCFAWGLASLAMFAYLGEKVPWLLVHQVVPFVILAGAQLSRTFGRHGRWWSRTIAATSLVATAWSALASSYLYPAITTSDPHAELIIFVQTTPEAGHLAELGIELARTRPGELIAAVDGEAAWPLSWQWKKISVWWAKPGKDQKPLLIVVDPGKEDEILAGLSPGWRKEQIPLRAWWVEDWSRATPGTLISWFLTRRAWSPVGATDIVVLTAPGVQGRGRWN